jgi:hypothetical protein
MTGGVVHFSFFSLSTGNIHVRMMYGMNGSSERKRGESAESRCCFEYMC